RQSATLIEWRFRPALAYRAPSYAGFLPHHLPHLAQQLFDLNGLCHHIHSITQEAIPTHRVLRVAGQEQHRQIRSMSESGICQFPPGKPGQTDIRQQKIDREVILQHRERCSGIPRFAATIPRLTEQFRDHHTHRWHVFDDQYVLAIAHGRVIDGAHWLTRCAGGPEAPRHLGALAHAAAYTRLTGGLPGETVDGRQTETGAMAERLGREERIEDLADDFGIDADAVVPDAERDVAAFSQPRTAGRVQNGSA